MRSRRSTRYWVNTVSLDHLRAGVEGGFTQADHGRGGALRRLSRGDLIAFYSPRTGLRSGQRLQEFTALARVADDAPYQVEMAGPFHPWRRRVVFIPCERARIQPLIEQLAFIRQKRHWGLSFRRGLFEVGAEDFRRIVRAMRAGLL